jgi:hypothetical protein
MYQSPVALDYTAAYTRDEALRAAEQRRLAHEVDSHTPAEHRLIAAAVMVLLVLVAIAVI